MKANELMIGDWVYSTFCDKPCKVIGIEQNESEYVNVKVTNVTGAKDINSLFFIPLTAEILEKNGFNYLNITDVWIWREGSSLPIHLDNYNEDGWRLLINCDNIPCECKFVNQLQHALRLCGIKKEIEL